MSEASPDPTELTAETAPGVVYERYLSEGVLAYQRCSACDSAVFYPRVLCPRCGSPELRWEASEGKGTVYSVTTLHPRNEDSYNVSLIDLAEGFRMMTNVVGGPAEDVHIGMPVRVQINQRGDENLPQFIKDDK